MNKIDIEGNNMLSEIKRKEQAVVRLYLTVLYLVTKNLVYINSRYFLAFHCVERDREVYASGTYKKEFADFAKAYLEDHPQNEHAQEYIKTNMKHANDRMIRYYRNTIEHLGAIRNADKYLNEVGHFDSYFELYHYLVQRTLIGKFEVEKERGRLSEADVGAYTVGYMQKVKKYHTYCKDFVKALNVPFAYNLARYKNLSIDGLFDRNDKREKPKGKQATIKPDEE